MWEQHSPVFVTVSIFYVSIHLFMQQIFVQLSRGEMRSITTAIMMMIIYHLRKWSESGCFKCIISFLINKPACGIQWCLRISEGGEVIGQYGEGYLHGAKPSGTWNISGGWSGVVETRGQLRLQLGSLSARGDLLSSKGGQVNCCPPLLVREGGRWQVVDVWRVKNVILGRGNHTMKKLRDGRVQNMFMEQNIDQSNLECVV